MIVAHLPESKWGNKSAATRVGNKSGQQECGNKNGAMF
jgi:hypothetical protein